MSDEDILIGHIEEGACFTLEELCAACALEREWLMHRVAEGLLPVSGTDAAEWRFSSVAFTRARRMQEIERNFDAVPELAALVADLLEEMDELRAQLRRAGLAQRPDSSARPPS
jgi:chaperone modulatory protein CbpM